MKRGQIEIRNALRESRRLFGSVALFSAFVNLLMLTGPVYMLQLYDRVLTSRSEATLIALTGIVAFLFLMMGLLDHARARVLARAGARFQAKLDPRVLDATLADTRGRPATGLHDLEAIQRFASGPGPLAFFDAPWTPVFLIVLFSFHWMMGVLATLSGMLLLALALANQARTASLNRVSGRRRRRHRTSWSRCGQARRPCGVWGCGMRCAHAPRGSAPRRSHGRSRRPTGAERSLRRRARSGSFSNP